MIQITPSIAINESEILETFIRSSGPGGQNVNKVSTAVQLRFDVAHTSSLSQEVRERLISMSSNQITEDGILIIDARHFRTQSRNRQDALDRLVELIRKAAEKPKIRHKTRATLASKQRRLDNKRHHSETKKLRDKHVLPHE
jgi:ribosome-associated protein